jgi:hypothetical protein
VLKIDRGQSAQNNDKNYLQAFDYYVSARKDALEGVVADDAPNIPIFITQDSPTNTDLLYYINSGQDEDWFRFQVLTVGGTAQIQLLNLPANYNLTVYADATHRLVGSSAQAGVEAELVTVSDISPGFYYVQVVTADGQWSAESPYTLRFDVSGGVVPTATPTFTFVAPTDTPTATATSTSTLTNTATPTHTPTVTPTSTSTPTATAMPVTLNFYLHGSGATANPPTLFLDSTAPTGTTAKYKDSASVNFSGGNLWKEVGAWTAAPAQTAGQLTSLNDLHVWLGLKNSDDIGTRFDLRAEVYRNGVLVTAGETYCITGVTRNADQAKEVVTTFAAFAPVNFDGVADSLTLKILVRIGTDGAGAFCGGHSNAVGVRLYFDSADRPARFEVSPNQ